MRYTKLILAFALVMVIVVMVGTLKCDAFSDVSEGLTLSSDFGRRSGSICDAACQKQKEKERQDKVKADLHEKAKGFRQDIVSLFTEINFNGRKYELADIPFDSAREEGAGKQIDPGRRITEVNNKYGTKYIFDNPHHQPMSAYIPAGFTLVMNLDDGTGKKVDGPSWLGGLYQVSCNPCRKAKNIHIIWKGEGAKPLEASKTDKKYVLGSWLPNSCNIDQKAYRYRKLKNGKCPRGWKANTSCQTDENHKYSCYADQKENVYSDYDKGKDKVRQLCDKEASAKKSSGFFKECSKLTGGKRTGCIGKKLPDCLRAKHAENKKKYEKKYPKQTSQTSATLFEHANFGGFPMTLRGFSTIENMQFPGGTMNNKTSSVKVMPGYKLILFEHSKYKGSAVELSAGDYSTLPQGWDDRASSAVVQKA